MAPSVHRPARPEVLAFLADIKDHPQEDGLRLIFSDWLEENGDSLDQARAELIRSQVEFARQPPESPTRPEHGRRGRALQQKYGNTWLGPLASWVGNWSFQRGLLSVHLSIAHLRSQALSALAGTEAWAWVDEVYVSDVQDSDILRIGQGALLSAIASLGFHRGTLGPAGAQALASLPLLQRLYRLDLSHREIEDRGLRALVASPFLLRLRILDLPGVSLMAESASVLAQAAILAGLERLNLWGNRLGNEGAAALARTDHLTCLKHLDLRGNVIGDTGAMAIAQAPALASLRELNLADNQIGPVGAFSLAGSPHLDGIASLILWGNPVGPEGTAALRERFGSRVHISSAPV